MNKIVFFAFIVLVFLSCSSKQEVPIYDYYKNIPTIRGWTNDDEPRSFMIEIVLVYRERNVDLKDRLNALKPSIMDELRSYLSLLKEEDYILENQPRIKEEAVHMINKLLLDSMTPKIADTLRDIDDLAELDLLLDVNILQLQIFNLN